MTVQVRLRGRPGEVVATAAAIARCMHAGDPGGYTGEQNRNQLTWFLLIPLPAGTDRGPEAR
jgi:hypothetical protein